MTSHGNGVIEASQRVDAVSHRKQMWRRWFAFASRYRESPIVVPALLVTVGILQISCATFGALTPWKGGGFGMFATLDHPGNRYIALSGTDADGIEYRILTPTGRISSWPGYSSAFLSKIIAFPTQEDLHRLAEAVLNAHLVPARRPPVVRMPQSPARLAVTNAIADIRILEVAAPSRLPASGLILTKVGARVLRVRFDVTTRSAQLVPVGPTAVVSRAIQP